MYELAGLHSLQEHIYGKDYGTSLVSSLQWARECLSVTKHNYWHLRHSWHVIQHTSNSLNCFKEESTCGSVAFGSNEGCPVPLCHTGLTLQKRARVSHRSEPVYGSFSSDIYSGSLWLIISLTRLGTLSIPNVAAWTHSHHTQTGWPQGTERGQCEKHFFVVVLKTRHIAAAWMIRISLGNLQNF